MSPVATAPSALISTSGAIGLGLLTLVGGVIFEILLADIQTLEQGLANTRAVPLVRKDDAHQGRVSFLPKFEASREGVTA